MRHAAALGKNYTCGSMTISYTVFLAKERMPSGADWLRAAKEAGLAIEFSESIDPATLSGYLPCPDDRAGFELYCEPYRRGRFDVSALGAEIIADRDTSLTFRFSGRPADREVAVAAAAALAAASDGILFDGEAGHFIDARSAIAWARNEGYRPVAAHRPRRRRSRIRASTVFRILMLLLVTVAFALLFG
jgi:hypothetical protein